MKFNACLFTFKEIKIKNEEKKPKEKVENEGKQFYNKKKFFFFKK